MRYNALQCYKYVHNKRVLHFGYLLIGHPVCICVDYDITFSAPVIFDNYVEGADKIINPESLTIFFLSFFLLHFFYLFIFFFIYSILVRPMKKSLPHEL